MAMTRRGQLETSLCLFLDGKDGFRREASPVDIFNAWRCSCGSLALTGEDAAHMIHQIARMKEIDDDRFSEIIQLTKGGLV